MNLNREIETTDKTIETITIRHKQYLDSVNAEKRFLDKVLIDLKFKKADLLYQEYRLDSLVTFCNTGKFE